MRSRLWRLVLFLTLATVLLGSIITNARAVEITEFSPFPAGGEPAYVTAGPDGNLWVTNIHADEIERVNTEGQRTGEFQIPIPDAEPYEIISGPEGLLWFTELAGDAIGTITTSGEVNEMSMGQYGGTLGIARGNEGNVWVTGNNFIANAVPSVHTVLVTPLSLTPNQLAIGPGDNVWFTDDGDEKIGFFNPLTREATELEPAVSSERCVAEPEKQKCPFVDAIVAGPEGALWYSEFEGREIGRITASGERAEFYMGLSEPSGINSFAVGPEGNIWFTEARADRVGWITPAGAITEVSAGISPGAYPYDITLGPEDNLWFTERTGDRLGRIIPNVPPVIATGGASAVTFNSATLTATVRSRGSETTYSFQYGTTTAYGASTTPVSNGAGDNTQNVTAQIGSLAPGTTYHYRIVASNANGQSYGADETFTTAPAPPPPPQPKVTVGSFEMYFAGYRVGRRYLHLTRIVILGATAGDRISYVCRRCHGFSTRATQIAHAGKVTFRTRALIVSGRSLLEIVVTGPDGSRRVRTYGFLIGQAESKLESQECFLPNDRAAVSCPGSPPAKPKQKPSGKHHKPDVRRKTRR
jgi:streptogramin lyase